jgi:uncharacterized surface protein with fasciclin (FAS1) repeats
MFKTIALSTAALFAAGVATAQCSYSKTAQAEQRSETTDFGNATASAEAGIIAPVADPDLIDLAVSVENLSTLVTAVKAAGLVETLKGKGPFTIFAPTNKAFASLPSGTLESLLKPENKDKLVKVLTYHVVSGAYPSDQVKDGMKPASVEGSMLNISVNDGAVKINDANVIQADVKASNGVVHVIDKVILPPGL